MPELNLEQAVRQLRSKSIATAKPRAYYKGQQASPFLGREGTSPYRDLVANLVENHCRNIIDLSVDRMNLTSIQATDPDDLISVGAAEIAWNKWTESRMDLRLREWITSCEVTGQPSALLVWPDANNNVRFYTQEPEQIAYSKNSETDELLWIAKAWISDNNTPGITIFYPDTVEVWQAPYSQTLTSDALEGRHTWNPLNSPDYGAYRLVEVMDNPLGEVPGRVIEKNYTDLSSVIPLQDQLNQTIANQAIAEYSFAIPVRVLMGFELPDPDDNGDINLPYKIESDRILVAPGAEEGAQKQEVYDLPGANPQPYIAVADSLRSAIVRVSRIPAHLLLQSGQFPSGEALRTAEAPFVAKVQQRMDEYGAVIADTAEIAARLETMLNGGGDITGLSFTAQWSSPVAQAQVTTAQVAAEWSSIGVPLRVIGTDLLGWDSSKAEQVEDIANEQAAQRAQLSASIFDAGPVRET